MRLRKLYVSCTIANTNVFQTFLFCWAVRVLYRLFIIELWKSHHSKSTELVYAKLVELFTAHLLRKRLRFYHFLRLRYWRNKNFCKHFWFFFIFRKIVSFHIFTKRNSLSREFRNFVVYKKTLCSPLSNKNKIFD